jgi:lysophospholipase L1-like esterase
MPTTTTIKVGESAKTIPMEEGRVLTLTCTPGGSGTAYLLDPVLGGNNSSRSWSLTSLGMVQVGPLVGSQRVLVTCSAGSIDATVGSSSVAPSAIARATFGAVRKSSGRGALRPVSCLISQSIGAGAGTGQTIDNEWAADAPFVGVIPIFWNWDTAAPLTVTKAGIAPSPRSLTPTQTALATAMGGAFAALTANNGQTTFQVPAATGTDAVGANPTNVVPSMLRGDLTVVSSIPRLDNAAGLPLARTLVFVPDSSILGSNGNPADWATYNADPRYAGRSLGMYKQNGDKVTTPAGTNVLANGGVLGLAALELIYGKNTWTIAEAGDSQFQGVGSTGNYAGPVLLACAKLSNAARMVSPLRSAMAGQKYEVSIRHAKNLLASSAPEVFVFPNYSVNDDGAFPLAKVEKSWALCQAFADDCRRAGTLPIIATVSANGSVGSAEANRLAMNQRTRDYCVATGTLLLDRAAILDNGNVLKAQYNFDGLHFNDAGHDALAVALTALLDPVLQ